MASTDTLSARDVVVGMFTAAGLDQDFVNKLMSVIDGVYTDNIAPTSTDVLTSIYASDAYKQRFAGNEIIRKRMASGQGMPGDHIMTPAEYLSLEESYRNVVSAAGLPAGFYDNHSDFVSLIGAGISAAELQNRVNTAADALQYADKNTVDMLQSYYGLSTSDLVAHLLDPAKAETVLTQKYTAAKVGGIAANQGVQIGQSFAEEIVKAGKASQAENAFSAADQNAYQKLGSIYGTQTGTEDIARAQLGLEGGATAKEKIKKLGQKERAAFSTQSGLAETALGRAADL